MRRLAIGLPLLLLASALLCASDLKDHPKGPRHESRPFNYSITAPNEKWSEFKLRQEGLDFAFANGNAVSVVIAASLQESEVDLIEISDSVVAQQKKAGNNPKVISCLPCRVLGETGRRLVLEMTLGPLPCESAYTIFQHQGVLYHIVATAPPVRMAQAARDVQGFLASFRFLGERKEWVQAHPPRPHRAEAGDASATFELGSLWTADAFDGQPHGSLWLRYGSGPAHLQVLVARSAARTVQAARESDETLTARVVEGYGAVARAEAQAGGRTWLTFEGKGTWGGHPTLILGASCLVRAYAVRVVLYWPDARAGEGKTLLASLLEAAKVEVPDPVEGVALPEAREQPSAASQETIEDLKGAELVMRDEENKRLLAFAPSPDGSLVAVSKDISLEVVEVGRKRVRLVGDGRAASHLAWSADGKTLWFVGATGQVATWDAESGETKPLGRTAIAAAPGADGRLLLVELVDGPRPNLGYGVAGPHRLVSVREDGKDEHVLHETRLSKLVLGGADPGTGRELILDFDAGVLRGRGATAREPGADGTLLDVPGLPTGSLTWAARAPEGILYETVMGSGAEEDGTGGRLFLYDPKPATTARLDLPPHYGGFAVDAKGRLYFRSWSAPDGTYATCLYRLPIVDAVRKAAEAASGEPLDEEGLTGLDAKLAALVPDRPGAAELPPKAATEAAGLLASALGPHVKGGLRLQAASIDALADLVQRRAQLFARHPRSLLAAGCYAAEVLRHEFGAEWAPGDGRIEAMDFAQAEDSPGAYVMMPLAEFWSLANAEEGGYSTVEYLRATLKGRSLLLALSRGSAQAACAKAEGEDLSAARKAWEGGDAEASLAALAKAIQAHPKSVEVRLYAFERAYVAGKLDLAARWAEEASTLDPRCADAWSDRGVLVVASDPDRALEWLRKAAELEPAAGEPFLRLGYAYLAKKDPKAAKACFERASEDGSTAAEAARMLERLRRK